MGIISGNRRFCRGGGEYLAARMKLLVEETIHSVGPRKEDRVGSCVRLNRSQRSKVPTSIALQNGTTVELLPQKRSRASTSPPPASPLAGHVVSQDAVLEGQLLEAQGVRVEAGEYVPGSSE